VAAKATLSLVNVDTVSAGRQVEVAELALLVRDSQLQVGCAAGAGRVYAALVDASCEWARGTIEAVRLAGASLLSIWMPGVKAAPWNRGEHDFEVSNFLRVVSNNVFGPAASKRQTDEVPNRTRFPLLHHDLYKLVPRSWSQLPPTALLDRIEDQLSRPGFEDRSFRFGLLRSCVSDDERCARRLATLLWRVTQ
jgi:hypothetical protein